MVGMWAVCCIHMAVHSDCHWVLPDVLLLSLVHPPLGWLSLAGCCGMLAGGRRMFVGGGGREPGYRAVVCLR